MAKVEGYVCVDGVETTGYTVYVYDQDTGALIGSDTSDSAGSWSVEDSALGSDLCFAVCVPNGSTMRGGIVCNITPV